MAKNEMGVEEAVGEFSLWYEISERLYTDDVINKAKTLREMFPGKDMKEYCEAVKNSGNATLEELIETFMMNK